MQELRVRDGEDRLALIRKLASDPQRDEIKLWVTSKALQFRRAHPDLFARGDYIPLETRGARAAHVCAFARRLDADWVVIVVPRWTRGLDDWNDTEVVLPEGAPTNWQDELTCVFPASWRMRDLLAEFPVAMVTPVGPRPVN